MWSDVRLSAQAVFMGLDTSPHDLILTRAIKAIKSGNYGGPKEKHLDAVLEALSAGTVSTLEVITCLDAINWKKESVRAVRIVGFFLEMFKHGAKLQFNNECLECTLLTLDHLQEFWCQPQPRPRPGYTHWDSPVIKRKFANLVAYAKGKAYLLVRCRGKLPLFTAEDTGAVWQGTEFASTQSRIDVLSLSLTSMTQLAASIASIEEPAPLSDSEQASFRSTVPQLLLDLRQLLVVNTVFIVAVAKDTSLSTPVSSALVEEYRALKTILLSLRVTTRAGQELIFRAGDFPSL
jgi:hypothetical protein